MKWGVLGTASIATRSVMPAIQEVGGNKLVAVASRTRDKADAVAAAFGIDGLADYEALLDRSDVDAVYIPLPNGMHFEWVMKALEAGKHVLVEKSAFVTLEDAKAAVALARKRRLAIVENFQFQHHSQHRAVRQLMDEGAIGAVRGFRASFGFPPFGGRQNIRYDRALGGGALLDAGAYTLKAAQFMFGRDLEVQAAHMAHNEEYDVDWFGGAFLVDHERGICSELAWGFDNFYQCNYEVWGATGKITATRAYTAKADFKPILVLEQAGGMQQIELEADDHFRNMLLHFNLLVAQDRLEEEFQNLLSQSKAIEDVRRLGERKT